MRQSNLAVNFRKYVIDLETSPNSGDGNTATGSELWRCAGVVPRIESLLRLTQEDESKFAMVE